MISAHLAIASRYSAGACAASVSVVPGFDSQWSLRAVDRRDPLESDAVGVGIRSGKLALLRRSFVGPFQSYRSPSASARFLASLAIEGPFPELLPFGLPSLASGVGSCRAIVERPGRGSWPMPQLVP